MLAALVLYFRVFRYAATLDEYRHHIDTRHAAITIADIFRLFVA